MPNKITDEVLAALLEAHLFADPETAVGRALEAYERAKWRPGAPTEDGRYICEFDHGGVDAAYVWGALYHPIGIKIEPSKILRHQPFPEPPKEGE